MKSLRFAVAALIVLGLALLSVPAARAEGAPTLTRQSIVITEAQINASYWVTNPARRSVTNRHVTLGDGLVTIDATLTHADGKAFSAQTVWKPYITSAGALVFNFQSATVNALPASAADRSTLIQAHRYAVRNAIRDYIRDQVGGPFRYVAIAVVPGQVTVTVDVYAH